LSTARFFKLPATLAGRSDLPAGTKIVFAVIADRIGGNGICWPGVRRLAKDCGMSDKAVLANVARLEAAGLVAVERRGSGRSNRYRLASESAPESTALGPVAASESAPESTALPKGKRSRKVNTGAPEGTALALRKGAHNQTDQLNQTRKDSAAAKPPPDSRVKTFIDWFSTAYKTALGRPYIVAAGKDGAIVKRLLRGLNGDGQDPVAALQDAAGAMFADDWGRSRASIGLLASQINTWLGGRQGSRKTFTPAKSAGPYNALAKEYET
jgi:DNA-binding transcriptional ArsR family regulator